MRTMKESEENSWSPNPPAHSWFELGISTGDRVFFMCDECDLRVSVVREGAASRFVQAAMSGQPYPTEPLPTSGELSSIATGCPGRAHARGSHAHE